MYIDKRLYYNKQLNSSKFFIMENLKLIMTWLYTTVLSFYILSVLILVIGGGMLISESNVLRAVGLHTCVTEDIITGGSTNDTLTDTVPNDSNLTTVVIFLVSLGCILFSSGWDVFDKLVPQKYIHWLKLLQLISFVGGSVLLSIAGGYTLNTSLSHGCSPNPSLAQSNNSISLNTISNNPAFAQCSIHYTNGSRSSNQPCVNLAKDTSTDMAPYIMASFVFSMMAQVVQAVMSFLAVTFSTHTKYDPSNNHLGKGRVLLSFLFDLRILGTVSFAITLLSLWDDKLLHSYFDNTVYGVVRDTSAIQGFDNYVTRLTSGVRVSTYCHHELDTNNYLPNRNYPLLVSIVVVSVITLLISMGTVLLQCTQWYTKLSLKVKKYVHVGKDILITLCNLGATTYLYSLLLGNVVILGCPVFNVFDKDYIVFAWVSAAWFATHLATSQSHLFWISGSRGLLEGTTGEKYLLTKPAAGQPQVM